MRWHEITETKDTLELPDIDVGDTVLVGKFKNRRAEVKGFSKDEKNQPVLKTDKGDQKLFKPRIEKLMTEQTESPFAGMTRDQFLGTPKITPKSNASDLKPNALLSVREQPREPFMNEFTASYCQDGAAVFKHDELEKSWFAALLGRRPGISCATGRRVLARFRDDDTSSPPLGCLRSCNSRSPIQTKVWDRIQRELRSNSVRAKT